MADPVVEEILGLIGADRNLTRLAELLVGLTDAQRKALSRSVTERTLGVWVARDGRNTAALAVLGCLTGVRQVASRLAWIPVDEAAEPLLVEVLAARRPQWLASLPEALLVRRQQSLMSQFRLVRAVVRAGLVERPEFPEYVHAMVPGLAPRYGWGDGPTVLDRLRADPGLLDEDVWALFTTEGAGKALANHDGWLVEPKAVPSGGPPALEARPERGWQHALVVLAGEGVVDRERLLDATLGAFFRDWTAGDVGWFVKLHDSLAPTTGELRAREARYGRLLAVEPGPAVSMGLRALGVLLASGQLDLEVLTSNVPAVLTRRDKGPVAAAVKLVEKAAASIPAAAAPLAAALAGALDHESADVRERARALISRLVPDQDGGAAPGGGPPASPATPATPAPGRLPPTAVVPVADADELAELFAHLVEEADDPCEVERLLEGVARLAGRRPARGAEALVKRLRALAGEYHFPGAWSGEELRADLVRLGLVWLERLPPGAAYLGRQYDVEYHREPPRAIVLRRPDWSLGVLVTLRVHEVARAVEAGGASLLSLPTLRDGSVDAAVLSARAAEVNRLGTPLPLDAGLAVLRVPPEQYSALQLPAMHRTGRLLAEQLAVLQQHRPRWERVVGQSDGRFRREVYERAVSWRDLESPGGGTTDLVRSVLDRRDPLQNLALESSDGDYAPRFDQVTAMWPLMLPHHPDLLAAHAHARLNRGLTRNRSGSEPLLAGIGASRRPLGAPALSALVLGLAAKNGTERARAVDALVDASAHGTLAGGDMGEQLGGLLAAEVIVGSRVVPGLADAARAGGAPGGAVLDCLTAVLPVLPGHRAGHHFVDLLAKLAVQEGRRVELPSEFSALADSGQSSVLARACRRIPRAGA